VEKRRDLLSKTHDLSVVVNSLLRGTKVVDVAHVIELTEENEKIADPIVWMQWDLHLVHYELYGQKVSYNLKAAEVLMNVGRGRSTLHRLLHACKRNDQDNVNNLVVAEVYFSPCSLKSMLIRAMETVFFSQCAKVL
jgi:hypothetical protein